MSQSTSARCDYAAGNVIAVAVFSHVDVIYTNPRQAAIVQKYFQDVGAFEREASSRRG